MRSNLSTEKKLNTLVKKSVDLKPLQILGWKGIKSKNTAILTLKYPSWEQKVRRPRVKKSGDKKSGKTSNLQGKLVFVQKWGRRTFSMEIGWFWGEIRVLWWRQLINTAVGHYLWGIDTIFRNNNSFVIFKSDITYEELIHSASEISPARDFSRTLPMRNWYRLSTSYWLSCSSTFLSRRTLPMRNWYNNNWHFISFFIFFVGHYLWGIDTCSVLMPNYRHKSDITYEELIHFPL